MQIEKIIATIAVGLIVANTSAQNDGTSDKWEDSGNNIITSSNFNGRVGIKTTSPEGLLHINSADTVESIVIGDGPNESTTRFNAVVFTKPNTGIGDNMVRWLDGRGNLAGGIATSVYQGEDALSILATKQNSSIRFILGSVFNVSEKIRFTSSGEIGVLTTTPSEQLDVVGNARFRQISTGSNDFITTHETNGTLHKIAFTGNQSDVLLGNGTFGAAPATTDLDWDIQGNNMQAIPTGNIGVGALPNSSIKFYTSDNNDAVQVTGSFEKISSANQVGSATGVRGYVENHANDGFGVVGIARSSTSGAKTIGVDGMADGDGFKNIGCRATVSGAPSNEASGVQAVATSNAERQYAIEARSGESNTSNSLNIGAKIDAYGNTKIDKSLNYGISSIAHYNNSTGYNFGVFASGQQHSTNTSGSPILNYGVSSYTDKGGQTNRAGYFNGDLEYTGMLIGPSDEKLKQNVKELNSSVLTLINQLKPKSYEYKQDINGFNLPTGEQYGFIAQELEKVLPQFVSQSVRPAMIEGDNKIEELKYKSVSYIGLVPILTKAIQEQQLLIESQEKELLNSKNNYQELKDEIEELKKLINEKQERTAVKTTDLWLDEKSSGFLGQNEPNPFSEITSIPYFIPEDTKNIHIEIYNLEGQLLKSKVLEPGNGIVKIYASDFESKKLIYRLIADGKLIDTKKMYIIK